MNEQQLFQAFEKVIDAKVYNKLKDTIVLHDGDTYRLFEKYGIDQIGLDYQVSKLTSDTLHLFSSLKYAVTWVTLDNLNSIYEANRVLELDRKLSGLEMNIKLYEKYLTKPSKNIDFKFICSNKLYESKVRKRHVLSELEHISAKTKNRQLSRFSQSSYKLK